MNADLFGLEQSEPRKDGRPEAEHTTADLIAAINRCCDVRGESAGNRAGLITEAADFTLDHQRDLADHFNGEADRWHRANRGDQP